MKILYIPAENVNAKVSRSYFIAKGFSSNHEVYKIKWQDNRNRFWEGKKASSFYTAKCFINSLFSFFKIQKSNDFGYTVHSSVFLNAFIGKIIGNYSAIKLMRNYNLNQLKKIIKKIEPDIIYHADGFYFFPALNSSIPEFSDLQDDINWNNIPLNKQQEEFTYYSKQFGLTKLNFIVSENAAISVNRFVKCQFIPFDNGADFQTLRNYSSDDLTNLKSKFNIPTQKTLISYVGGVHKFDENFTFKLANTCLKELPHIHFLLIGNLPKVELANITNLGFLTTEDANKIYSISDIGITLKNTHNNDFLYNSVPLKFIQYGAVRKPIITFPIKWSENHQFSNIFHVEGENIENWIATIKNVSSNFKWSEELENRWQNYDWQTIADNVLKQIEDKLNIPSNK